MDHSISLDVLKTDVQWYWKYRSAVSIKETRKRYNSVTGQNKKCNRMVLVQEERLFQTQGVQKIENSFLLKLTSPRNLYWIV